MVNNSLKYTCLFGGGAIRGAAYAGAVKALEELNITPENIGGSSVGSIVAALMAVGYNADDLKEIFLDVNFDLFRDFQFGLGPKFALSKGEVFLDWIRDLIEQKFYGENYEKGRNKAVTFKELEKNLYIITTDLSNFECKEFSKFETPDFEIATAVRISCSMPGLMKPMEYNNTLLVDGDLQKSVPMWKLSKNLTNDDERILEFRLEGDFEGSNRNALDYVNTIYSCITSIATSFIVELYGKKDRYDCIVLNTGDVIVVDFNYPKEKREDLIKSGYEQTMAYFTKTLPQKKENLLDNYYILNKSLKKIEKFIESKKIVKAKHALSELFVLLCDIKDYIDANVTNAVQEFNREFCKNVRYPALFGKAKLVNETDVKSNLQAIINLVTDKIYELESYLVKFPI